MKMQKSVLLAMACTAVQAADFTLDTSASVGVSARLPRTTAFGSIDADILGVGYNFLLYSSVAATTLAEASADVSATEAAAAGSGTASASASFSGVFSGLAAGTGMPPSFYMASFDFAASASADGSASAAADEEKEVLFDGKLDADMSASAGFLGMVYSGLTERKANGDFVKFTSFAGDIITAFNAGFDYDVSAVTNEGGGVKSAFMHAKEGSLEIKFTVVASDNAGLLSSGSVITPTSVETIVDIEGYDYDDAANHLELVVAVATASAQASATGYAGANGAGTKQINSGSGASQMYVDFATMAQVDNVGANVQVEIVDYLAATVGANAEASAEIDGEAGLDILGASLKAMLSASATGSANTAANAACNLVTVKFPAGANKITFDPTAGAGTPPSDPLESAASSAALSLIAVASTFVAFFL